jgi:hypothetical protein
VLNPIKLYIFVTDVPPKKAGALVPEKPFKPGVIFAGKARSNVCREIG